MRNIPQAALDTIVKKYGVEPILIVEVHWGTGSIVRYCDRKFGDSNNNLVGKLLNISNIEDVIDVNSSASSASISVALDDADGSIKEIFNNVDIHKNRVKVIQWFSNLSIFDAFTIFEGVVSSPIVWKEGERSLSFDVVTKLEDTEVGFSADEASYPVIPANLIGKPWPIVFGIVSGLKPLKLIEPPELILAEGFGIINEEVWEAEIDNIRKSFLEADLNSRLSYDLGVQSALKASQYKGFFNDDPRQADQYETAAAAYYAQSGEYTDQRILLGRELDDKIEMFAEQKALCPEPGEYFQITQSKFPPPPVGEMPPAYNFDIGDFIFRGSPEGQKMKFMTINRKPPINRKLWTGTYEFNDQIDKYQKDNSKENKFTWIEAGTQFKVIDYPTIYIVSLTPITVYQIYGYTETGRTVIPPNYYKLEPFGVGGTRLVFEVPLVTRPGFWINNEIEVDCNGHLSSNPISIMEWAIQNYSTLGMDPISFTYVKNKLNKWPANFVLQERKNLITFLQELAFQARCAIWINDSKFYVRYLAERPTPVDTITQDDIEVDTLEVTCTETERIVTKFVAEWFVSELQKDVFKIITRYNIPKYGTHEETHSFYIYTNAEPVQKAAEFWIIRKANTWKRIKFRTMLHKLNLEMFDCVTLDFGDGRFVSNNPVIGIIEKASFDSATDTIQFEIWVPVRFGEMVEYEFSFPMEVLTVYPILSDPNTQTGNPFAYSAGGSVYDENRKDPTQHYVYTHGGGIVTAGRGLPIADATDSTPLTVTTALAPSEVNFLEPDNLVDFNNENLYVVNPVKPFELINPNPSSFFGRVKEKINDKLYVCSVYFNGLTNDPNDVEVNIAEIREGTTIAVGYPITVNRIVYLDQNEEPVTELWAQPPVWVPLDNENNPP